MNWNQMIQQIKSLKNFKCRACRECNGIACRGEIPGVGGKGTGSSFIRNYQKLNECRIHMDLLYRSSAVDTHTTLFGVELAAPLMAAPIAGISQNYGEQLSNLEFSRAMLQGCAEAKSLAFTGDGAQLSFYTDPLESIREVSGRGIPTIKPWAHDEVFLRIDLAQQSGAVAIAMDVDAAGLPLMTQAGAKVSSKSVEDLSLYTSYTDLPFIVKGIMTAKAAERAIEAGASAIVVSNHGGRVLDQTLSTVEVLPEIVRAVGSQTTILVDGGFRTGIHLLIALALGAKGVLIGRPFALAAYSAQGTGVSSYAQMITAELQEAMMMSGVKTLNEIDASLLAYMPF